MKRVSRPDEAKTPYDYANPFIGTEGEGHTYPGATVPFGWSNSVLKPMPHFLKGAFAGAPAISMATRPSSALPIHILVAPAIQIWATYF
jgi:hypothetical protein